MTPLALSLEVAALATLLVVAIGLPIAFALMGLRPAVARGLELICLLPLVIPPSVTGLALLWLLGANGPLGSLAKSFGVTLLFTPFAAVLASAAIAFPLFLRSARVALAEVDVRLLRLARVLGDSPFRAALRVHLPLARRGLLGGSALAFGRALGEFGATLMVAGNIEGKTETLAVSVYDHWLAGEWHDAWLASGALALVGVIVLAVLLRLEAPR